MLQFLREKTTGWLAVVIVAILAVPFAFFGINNYFEQQNPTYVAKVGELEISQEQFQQRWNEYRQQMKQMLGEAFDAERFEDAELRREFLERMIDEQVLRQAAAKMEAVVTPDRVAAEIQKVEAFQIDGQFNADRYRAVLAAQRMTVGGFEGRVFEDLENRLLTQPVLGTAFATEREVNEFVRLRDQTRSFDRVDVPPVADEALVADEDALRAFHSAHAADFTMPERFTVEWLEVDAANLDAGIEPSDAELRRLYEAERERFGTPEARHVAHILFAVPADAPAEVVKSARERADAAFAKLTDEKADFAAIAAEVSEDLGSKNDGGELGFIERGQLDPAFETEVFAMTEPGLHGPVRSDEGWHIISLKAIRAGDRKAFDEVRAELADEYLAGERERMLPEVTGKLVDIVYRDPSTLAAAANELGMTVERREGFAADEAEGLLAEPAVRRFYTSERAIAGREASDAIDLGNGRMVVVRVDEHSAAAPLAFADARPRVETAWRLEQRSARSRAKAEAIRLAVIGGKSLADAAAAAGLEVIRTDAVGRGGVVAPPAVRDAAFLAPRAAEGQGGVPFVVEPGDGSASVVVVQSVTDGDPTALDPAQREALAAQISQGTAALEIRALVDALRQDVEIDVVESRLTPQDALL